MTVGKDLPLVQKQLAKELLRLRKAAGLGQEALGELIKESQSTVSRAERGIKLLSVPQVAAWAQACGASHEAKDRLSALAQAAFTQSEAWRDLMPKQAHLQDSVKVNETTARTLLNYSPTVIPGLLQTPAYAEHVFRLTNYTGDMDEAAALAGRWRRQEALGNRARRFDFLLPESVLHWSPAGPNVLASQLDRVATVAAQDNVSIGIIRAGSEVVLPLHGFVIYADRGENDPFVVMELAHTYVTENNPVDVALYQALYERMSTSAVTGQDAIALVQQVADEYRRLTG